MIVLIAFYGFAALTLAFAGALLWRLLPRAPQPKQEIAVSAAPERSAVPPGGFFIEPAGGSQTAEVLKAVADAVSTTVKAIRELGSQLEFLGPAVILGAFTVIFALCTLATAWMAR
jgi:hypothetical protein